MRRAVAAIGGVLMLVVGLLFTVGPGSTARWISSQGTTAVGVWRVQRVPSPSGTVLMGVSCPSANGCTAVGLSTSLRDTVVLSWDGTQWTEQHLPSLRTRATAQLPYGLIGVSCVSTAECLAVGPYVPYVRQPLGARWDGAHWALALPKQMGWPFRLIGLSCASKAFCVAVGRAPGGPSQCSAGKCTGKTSETVVEQWGGSRWHVQPSPTPPGALDLYGVSCASRSFCMAVGSGMSGVLAERWDGDHWQVQRAANPRSEGNLDTGHGLRAVSCVSPRFCVAVGDVLQASVTGLIERWGGASWRISATPAMATDVAADLTSVSCVANDYCVAVGAAVGPKDNEAKPLVERWDGASWAVEASPVEPDQSGLYGVSCASVANCAAVGTVSVKGHADALVERLTPT